MDDGLITDGNNFEADASDAYILIPGSLYSEYGGNSLSQDSATTPANMDDTSGAVDSYGIPFRLIVVSHTDTSGTNTALGFSLVYRLLPCSMLPRTFVAPA